MEEKTDYLITREGKMFRRYTQLDEIDPGEAIQKAYAQNITTTARNFMELPGHGLIHLVQQQAEGILHVSVPLETINFRTSFKAITTDEGYKNQLYPSFHDKHATDPMMEIEWVRADAMLKQEATMRLRFHVLLKPNNDGGWYAFDHYLYAFDGRGVAFRLPIANIFDTCQLCMGEYNSKSETAIGTVQKALQQFRTATWNADLFKNATDVWKFIRFKALDKGFATQPIIPPWTTMCAKVNTAYLKYCQV
jgi:hypothetical protein